MDIQEQKNAVLSYISPAIFIKGLVGIILFYALVFVYGIFQNAAVLKSQNALVLDSVVLNAEPALNQTQSTEGVHSYHPQTHQNEHGDIELEAQIYNPSEAVEQLDHHSQEHGITSDHAMTEPKKTAPSKQTTKKLSVEQLEQAFYGHAPIYKWIPKIGPNNETVFETYAYDNKFPLYNDETQINGKISLVFIDAGTTDKAILEDAVAALPPVFSFAWYPYSEGIEDLAKNVYLKGFENWSTLLVQPDNYPLSDYGVLALSKEMGLQDAAKKAASATMNIPYSVGFVSHQRSNFFSNRQSIQNLKKILSALGMGYIHAQSNLSMQRSFVDSLAYAESDMVIDNVASPASIRANLANLEMVAKESGYAIGYVHLYPKTLEVLKAWVPTIQDKNLQLVSTSSLLKGNF